MMNQTVKTVSTLGISHMLIDAACIYTLYYSITHNELNMSFAFIIVVLYNLLAFGLQAIIGDFFDKRNNPRICTLIGFIFTTLAPLLWNFPLSAAILAGFGNAFFHVGGGIICLKLSNGKASIPGIYVAPGALGLFLGALAVKGGIIPPYYISVLLLIFAMLTAILMPSAVSLSKMTNYSISQNTDYKFNSLLFILNLLLLSIVIRSFIGLSITITWKENIMLMLFLTLAVVFGKMFGGIIADKFGWMKISVFALLISSPLIAFGINNPVLYITGIFFFNFTMPVTLSVTSNVLKGREGFAFGLTTLALITGAFPVFGGVKLSAENSFIIFAIIITSALLIYCGLRKYFDIFKTQNQNN